MQGGFIFILKKLNCSVQIAVPTEKKSTASPICTKFKPWVVALKIFSCLQQNGVVISPHCTNTSEESSQHGGDGRADLVPSIIRQSLAPSHSLAKGEEGHFPSLNPGSHLSLLSWPRGSPKDFLSIFTWWRLDSMSSSLTFYILSAWYILWACANLGAVLVTPHFFSHLPPSWLETTWECF